MPRGALRTDAAAVAAAVQGADVVLHIASLVDLRDNIYRRHRLYDINVSALAVLLNGCIRRGVTRFVYLGSAAAIIGRTQRPRPLSDERVADVEVYDISNHYGKSKAYERP